MGTSSSCTPNTRTSWPISRSVRHTSHSVFHPNRSASSFSAASGGGTSSGCIKARTRSRLIRPGTGNRELGTENYELGAGWACWSLGGGAGGSKVGSDSIYIVLLQRRPQQNDVNRV